MEMNCTLCGTPISDLVNAYVRVSGWGKGSKNGVKELFDVSAPFGYACNDCGWKKSKGMKVEGESLF